MSFLINFCFIKLECKSCNPSGTDNCYRNPFLCGTKIHSINYFHLIKIIWDFQHSSPLSILIWLLCSRLKGRKFFFYSSWIFNIFSYFPHFLFDIESRRWVSWKNANLYWILSRFLCFLWHYINLHFLCSKSHGSFLWRAIRKSRFSSCLEN